MSVYKQTLFLKDNRDVNLYTLLNSRQTEVQITNYGAIIKAFIIRIPGKPDNDIVLGFDRVEDYFSPAYLARDPFMGAAIGRYANRIKNGQFVLNGKSYQLAKNLGNDHLHGGNSGFDKKVWEEAGLGGNGQTWVELRYVSPDGEENYPGELDVRLRFTLTDMDELIYEYSAHSNADTIINLTHHSYFNLDHQKGNVSQHRLKIFASRYLEQDAGLCSTGRLPNVENTRFDFRTERPIGPELAPGSDYDLGFELDDKTRTLKRASEVFNRDHSLGMQIITTEPTIHLYTGNGLPPLRGKTGTLWQSYAGFCLETQTHAGAINIPGFPDTVLSPGKRYESKTVYRVAQAFEK